MPRECPPTRADVTVLELLFDSAAMVFFGRLLIVVAVVVVLACAFFVLGSIAVRARSGHWLRRAGPFEVSENTTGEVDLRTRALEMALVTKESQLVEFELLLECVRQALTDKETGDS